MKRQVITIQEDMVIYAPHHGEVWMTAWEIAELFYVSGITVRNTIKRIFKQGVLKEFETYRHIKLENGNSADVYNLEMVMAIAFQWILSKRSCSENGWLGRLFIKSRMLAFKGSMDRLSLLL